MGKSEKKIPKMMFYLFSLSLFKIKVFLINAPVILVQHIQKAKHTREV